MRWFTFTLMLLAATLLDAGNLLAFFDIGSWHIRPTILVTLLVYYSLACRTNEAITCAFLIGIAADLATGSMGPHMLCYGLFGSLINSVAGSLSTRKGVLQAAFVLLAALVTGVATYWLTLLKTRQPVPDAYPTILLAACYSAVLAPLLWSVLELLAEWSGMAKTNAKRTR